jgi:hypothetical protein
MILPIKYAGELVSVVLYMVKLLGRVGLPANRESTDAASDWSLRQITCRSFYMYTASLRCECVDA